jgi:VanZ family protein
MNLRYALLALFVTLSIVYISSMSSRSLWGHGSISEQVLSNLSHVPVYALLAFLWFKSFKGKSVKKRLCKTDFLVLAGLVLFAVSDEIHQFFVPGRSASLMDIALNMFGIILGLKIFQKKSC